MTNKPRDDYDERTNEAGNFGDPFHCVAIVCVVPL
jgi:hypothetical protein